MRERTSDDVWDDVARWWVDAVRDDPAHSVDFVALLSELVSGADVGAGLTLDVGCGEGQGMRAVGGATVGTDISMPLLRQARAAGPVVAARLPDVSWARSGAFDRGICVGVLEVVADHHTLFRELHRVLRPGGQLVVVTNHPVTTAPHSQPMIDAAGETFWRWGTYLEPGEIDQEMGEGSVVLHHRPLGDLLTAAAAAGWRLDRLIEHGPSEATRARYPDYFGQEHVPVLAGISWTRQ